MLFVHVMSLCQKLASGLRYYRTYYTLLVAISYLVCNVYTYTCYQFVRYPASPSNLCKLAIQPVYMLPDLTSDSLNEVSFLNKQI